MMKLIPGEDRDFSYHNRLAVQKLICQIRAGIIIETRALKTRHFKEFSIGVHSAGPSHCK
jgi:hypothetical protein